MIDLHAHILPGLDDGPATLDEALAILRSAARDGVEVIAATPHVRDDYPTTADAMESGLAEVRRAADEAGIPIRVVGGGEIAVARLGALSEDELRRFALGGSRYVLVEPPYAGWPLDLAHRLFELQVRDLTPVIAHPERNPDVQDDPELLRPHVERGALVQVTAASIDGRLGRRTAAVARELVRSRLAHLLASDAHGFETRAVGLRRAATAVGDDGLSRWLVRDVPAAMLEGRELPPRPSPSRGRFAGLRRRSS